jgi:hypothetical protein
MNHKISVSISILVLSLVGELFLWNHVVTFSLLLMFLAYAKHKLYPIKKELLWYVFICVSGAIVEIILVNFGQGWTYSNSNLFGIPIWIPFFWGLIGTTIVVLYDGLTNKTSTK